MEFLPPKESESTLNKGKGKERWTRVRIAWFYRLGDVTDRQGGDSRLLLAAIYSEVVPITHVRSKCYVRHRDKIADLVAWKKKPDRFYFHKAFDPYIKKEFEVLLSADITNCACLEFPLPPVFVCYLIPRASSASEDQGCSLLAI